MQPAAAMWSETDLDTEQQLLGHTSLASSQAGTLRLKENGHGHSLGQQVRASNEPTGSLKLYNHGEASTASTFKNLLRHFAKWALWLFSIVS